MPFGKEFSELRAIDLIGVREMGPRRKRDRENATLNVGQDFGLFFFCLPLVYSQVLQKKQFSKN